MRPTEHNTKTSPAATGFFATFCGLLDVKGSGMSKTAHESGAPSARRLILAALATTLGALPLTTAPALAAAPEVVSEFTSSTAKPSEEVRLEAAINPENEATKCDFQYGETAVSEHEAVCTEPAGGIAEGGEQRAAVTVTSLKAGTTYHWRVVLKNASGKAEGNPAEVTTVPVPSTEAPSVVGSTTATFHGKLAPLNKTVPTEYFFYYHLNAEPVCLPEGETQPHESAGTGAGTTKAVTSAVTELEPNHEYTVCLADTNVFGGTEVDLKSPPIHFTTRPASPKVDSQSAGTDSAEATLEAQVNPNNQETHAYLQYSASAAVNVSGSLSAATQTETPPGAEVGSNYENHLVGPAALTGLAPGTTYYYQAVATNVTGTTYGAVQEFTTVPTPSTDPVTAIGSTTATFNGHLSPLNSNTATEYHFDYNLGTACAGGGETSSEEAGKGAGTVAKAAPVTGLTPGRLYTVCFATSNASLNAFGSQVGPAVSFRVLPETYVTEVGSSSATLHAVLDPEGATTTYGFQYGTSSSYGSETERAGAGASAKPISVEVPLQGLSSNTVYHFRVVGSVDHEVFSGADATFTTQPSSTEFTLLDGRQYEMVSPPDKHGGSIDAIPEVNGLIQASEDGSAITYITTDPIEAAPEGNRSGLEPSQVLARRGPDGWSDEEITTPNSDVGKLRIGEAAEYKFFSSDLSQGIVDPSGETPLAPRALPGETQERTIWLRDDASGGYLALVSAANTRPGTKIAFTEAEAAGIGSEAQKPVFEGASPDLSHVVLKDFAPLIEGAGGEDLYEWTGGRLSPVSVLPGNAGPTGGPEVQLGGEGDHFVVRHAVSDNGSRVIWNSEGQLYLRDMEREETVQIGTGTFQTANSEGSRVFFTTGNTHKEAGAGDLYVFEETEASRDGGPLAGAVTNLTGVGTGVQGEVIGASEDGSYVYFVANGLLGDAAEHGASGGDCYGNYKEGRTCNLYVDHYDGSGWEAPRYIATLSAEDGQGDWSDGGKYLTGVTSSVSPNGRWLAFMSRRRLTGYDNTDVSEQEVLPGEGKQHADEEVYLYHTETSPSGQLEPGKLVCASCNPTGQRPEGVFAPSEEEEQEQRLPPLLVDQRGVWEGRWLAGNVPGWTPVELNGAQYQSRYLSDDGRLFFDSADALVPADVNKKENVYEYEPERVGDCQSTVAGADEVFEPASGGCVGLISSGTSSQESAFLDASEGGGDVFFMTTSQLAPQDVDQAYDIYDAHECTAASPCVSPPATASPPPCTTADSCRAASAPQPSIYGAGPSETFVGPGNLASPAPAVVRPKPKKPSKCKKGDVKNKKGKCVRKKKSKKKAKKSNDDPRAR
jgi:hypothetical protein